MKISFIAPNLKLYGGIRRAIELSNRLVEKGHDVSIFHTDGSPCDWMPVKAKILPLAAAYSFDHGRLIYISQEQFHDVQKMKAEQKFFYCLNLYNKKYL